MKYILVLLILFNMKILAKESQINLVCYLESIHQENQPTINFTKRQILAKQDNAGNGIFEVSYDKYKAILNQHNESVKFTYIQTIGDEIKIDLYENDDNKNILCALSSINPNVMVLFLGKDRKKQIVHQCEPKK